MARRKKARPNFQPARPGDLSLGVEEICRAEIDGAIDLLIRHYNLAAAHVLLSAAQANIRNVATREGKLLPNDPARHLNDHDPEFAREVSPLLALPYNALKHASGDRTSRITLQPELVELLLLIAVNDFVAIFGKLSARMMLYRHWAHPRYPDLFDYEDALGAPSEPLNSVSGDIEVALAKARMILHDFDLDSTRYESAAAELHFVEHPDLEKHRESGSERSR
ncbi:hypothetical protein [Mesorhizobium sp. YR577]|uniref:hypothetical protein n=1 Tax=Mesorhizobium sp. YR577 TaxID=1884373 RepID=UPI0008E49F94|nr:hypothetical protein [Mesorhizobium sp. YR577]SFT57787.1 hypothetical protein SAMN05518861_102304 [Mesorhizobium sp. YR577]